MEVELKNRSNMVRSDVGNRGSFSGTGERVGVLCADNARSNVSFLHCFRASIEEMASRRVPDSDEGSADGWKSWTDAAAGLFRCVCGASRRRRRRRSSNFASEIICVHQSGGEFLVTLREAKPETVAVEESTVHIPEPRRMGLAGSGLPSPDQVFMTRVGLQIPGGLTFESWERTGHQLSGIVDSSAWWLGDWLVYGKKNYVDRYQRAIKAVGLRYQTLRNYAWVARRFDLDRRRPSLTFQHHAEIASLPVGEQDRLLDLAERETWTTKQLRNAMRDERSRDLDEPETSSPNSQIAVPNIKLGRWRAAADSVGLELDHWVLSMLDRAAEEALSLDPPMKLELAASPE